MSKEYRMYINGEWVKAAGGKTFDDYNPFSGKVFATVAAGGKGEAKRAIEAATAAFPKWAQTSPSERRMYMLRAADVLENRQEEVMQTLREESGATLGLSIFQIETTAKMFREAAGQITNVSGEIIPADLPGALFMMLRQPVGVVAGISPWNAPLILSLRAVVFPIAYGNTTILKPSVETPVSGGLIFAEIFEEVGLPPGVFNVVINGPGLSEEVGDELIENPKVRRLSFTGSTEVGRKIAEKAGRHLKKVTLELGGSDPLIVLRDADIDYAVNAAVFGRFMHQGQICMSSKRIMVERPVAGEFIEKFSSKAQGLKVGDPCQPDTVIGPLINQWQLEVIKNQVEDSVNKGAKLVCGGKYEGLCYYPTVLTDVTKDMKVFTEEVFGPVAPIMAVKDADEAVGIANESSYGLSAGIITRDFQKGLEIAERLESGMVHINDCSLHDEPQIPFGGMKDSGYGKHGGRATIDEFTELRWISLQRTPRQYPF